MNYDCTYCGKHFDQYQKRSRFTHMLECLRRRVAVQKLEDCEVVETKTLTHDEAAQISHTYLKLYKGKSWK